MEADPEVRVDLEEGEGGGGLVIRRNSIHGAVPYVDVNDPGTRARMEVYKQERRNALRAKYKAEDYKTTSSDAPQDHPIIPSGLATNSIFSEFLTKNLWVGFCDHCNFFAIDLDLTT